MNCFLEMVSNSPVSGTFLCTVIHPRALSPATRHQTNFPALKIEIWTTGDHSYSLESCYKINYSNDSILCCSNLPTLPHPFLPTETTIKALSYFLLFSTLLSHWLTWYFPTWCWGLCQTPLLGKCKRWTVLSKAVMFSSVQLFAALCTVDHQAPLYMGFSRQEYWSGYCHLLLQGIFLTQGLNPCLISSPALAGRLFTTEPPQKPLITSPHLTETNSGYILEHLLSLLNCKHPKAAWGSNSMPILNTLSQFIATSRQGPLCFWGFRIAQALCGQSFFHNTECLLGIEICFLVFLS